MTTCPAVADCLDTHTLTEQDLARRAELRLGRAMWALECLLLLPTHTEAEVVAYSLRIAQVHVDLW